MSTGAQTNENKAATEAVIARCPMSEATKRAWRAAAPFLDDPSKLVRTWGEQDSLSDSWFEVSGDRNNAAIVHVFQTGHRDPETQEMVWKHRVTLWQFPNTYEV